jgi:uncharacterized 2Fe-2S/4Fe-4S cluster protein (DUF4445 family)
LPNSVRKDMSEIKVHSSGKVFTIHCLGGMRLLDVLREHGFEVFAPCGGNGTCGKCKVLVKDKGYVTSCLYLIGEDMEVIMPAPMEASILATQYEFSKILQLAPGEAADLSAYPFGLAIDIGTTTVVFYLVQLITGSVLETQTMMNPQGKYGADVISRIQYCITSEGGLYTLQKEIIDAVNAKIHYFTQQHGFAPDDIVKISVTGNTTMLHLLMGEDPASLAFVPFTPVFTEEQRCTAAKLNLKCNAKAELKVLPSLSAYIGADIIAGMASLAVPEEHGNYLYVDIGTNGEMALVTPGKVYACATAAGPAFEGANISCGMGALEGAIKSYSDQDGIQTVADMKPVGICGSGLIDLVAMMVRTGVLSSDGYLSEDYHIVDAEHSGHSSPIVITQNDIREIQLAKGAVCAGIITLIRKSGLTIGDVDAFYLAGGFGNYIRIGSAVEIGMIPAGLADKVISVGNASGTGAILAVSSTYFDVELSKTLQNMQLVELSDDDTFNLEFAMNMEFPVIDR